MAVAVHRLTLDQVEQMVATGVLAPDERVELLDGVLYDVSPQGYEHAAALQWLTRHFGDRAAAGGYDVLVQLPVRLVSPWSAPEPDLALVERGPAVRGPVSPLLVLEVAVTSLAYDARLKARTYAEAEMAEYWLVDLVAGRALVHRRPRDGRYEERVEVDGDGVLRPLDPRLPDLPLAPLLAFAGKP